MSFPIKVINLGSRGKFGFIYRKDLLEDVLWYLQDLIRAGKLEVTLFGDREFIGESWEEFLGLHELNYILRLRRDYRLPDGTTVELVYKRLSPGGIKEYRYDGWRVIIQKLKLKKGQRDDLSGSSDIEYGKGSAGDFQ